MALLFSLPCDKSGGSVIHANGGLLTRTVLLLALSLFGVASSATATPVSYSEAVSGDLSSLAPYTTLLFDVGLNTVSGSNQLSGGNFDDFVFTIPTGTTLTNITFAATTTATANTQGATLGYGLYSFPSDTFLESLFIELLPSPLSLTTAFDALLPLPAGTYHIDNNSRGGSALTGAPNWSTEYQWSFQVDSPTTPVPEPASLLLLGSGLAGVLHHLRRRKPRVQ